MTALVPKFALSGRREIRGLLAELAAEVEEMEIHATRFRRVLGELERLTGELKSRGDWPVIRKFIRGGTWRNFRVKYPEANRLYSRMMHLSDELAEMCQEDPALEGARRDLYRAQCNCAYWHGVFGGLYLPHLRDAVAQSLIDCENKIESVRCATEKWARVEARVSYDAANRRAVLDPAGGLKPGATYVATVEGGAGGAADLAGNGLPARETWAFTVRR